MEYRLEDDSEALTVHDGVIYDKDMKTLLAYPNKSKKEVFTVPFSVTKIDKDAFGYQHYLRDIRIPISVRKIPDSLKDSWIKVTLIKNM